MDLVALVVAFGARQNQPVLAPLSTDRTSEAERNNPATDTVMVRDSIYPIFVLHETTDRLPQSFGGLE
jgi:hypothetical protein